MNEEKINELKIEIDSIKEYIYSDLCIKCTEMIQKLHDCQRALDEYNRKNMDAEK